jgi:hypothetical protein
MSKRSRSAQLKPVRVPPIAVVGHDERARRDAVRRISTHWPAIGVDSMAKLGTTSVSGIAFLDRSATRGAGRGRISVPSALLDSDPYALTGLAVRVMAQHYTQIDSVTDVLTELAFEQHFTLKQAEMVILFCTELSREEIRRRLVIGENTLKTRVRLLCRALEAPAGMAQIAHRILRRAAQSKDERSQDNDTVAPPPDVSTGDEPPAPKSPRKRKSAGRRGR